MANFSISTDLLKVKGAFMTNIQGRTETKKCLCIPIDDSGLFLGEKGCYLNITAWELRDPKYTDTHCLKVSYDKDVYENMTEDERKMQPIVGGMHPIEPKAMQISTTTVVVNDNDLPF